MQNQFKAEYTSPVTFSSTQPPSHPEHETPVQVPHPQAQCSFQQSLSSSCKSQFFGESFRVQNFHVHNN
ncbi:hypothetical protein DPMN_165040 [Dreissena polymorpha]|uniref:Uncharacterized protein n=1 Tax=Dreissena polymorpha TaxID=45954 RepID=A0A9D4IW70_DREPO|nr:hypothetical protein DPMN_165040 [Dreissena polymorpha]